MKGVERWLVSTTFCSCKACTLREASTRLLFYNVDFAAALLYAGTLSLLQNVGNVDPAQLWGVSTHAKLSCPKSKVG